MRDILTACQTKCRSKSWNKVGIKSILRNIMCKIEDADDMMQKKNQCLLIENMYSKLQD